jgi:hypothetical protein
MNTLRACAVIGLGLSLAFASGCSDSKSNAKDGSAGGNRGTGGRGGGGTGGRTTTNTGQACTYTTSSGTPATLNPGQSFTNNCVRYTCVSGTDFTSSGSPCSDAGTTTPDTRPGPDVAAPTDTARPVDTRTPVDTDGGRDVQPSEAGRQDTAKPLDVGAPDVAVPADTAPPAPDLAALADLPIVCTKGGTSYNPGEEYAPDICNTCICLSTGDFACTNRVCQVDAGGID